MALPRPGTLVVMGRLFLLAMTAGVGCAHSKPAPPATEAKMPLPEVEPPVGPTDSEMVTNAQDGLEEMRRVRADVVKLLADAVSSRDPVLTNCVNEKLTQVKGLLRISELAEVVLQDAILMDERWGARHEYAKVSMARTKVAELGNDAASCPEPLEALELGPCVGPEEPQDDPTTPHPQPPLELRAPAIGR